MLSSLRGDEQSNHSHLFNSGKKKLLGLVYKERRKLLHLNSVV